MPQLLDALPFYSARSGGRATSYKQYPLQQLLELRFGNEPPCGGSTRRPAAPLPDPSGQGVHVKSNQVLVWIALGPRSGSRGDPFPAILDPGCNHILVASQWHLENWARSAGYDPFACRVKDFVLETVANAAPGQSPPPGQPRHLLGRVLGTVLPSLGHSPWVPVVETDIWLSANERGERDELSGPDAWFRLVVSGIMVRPGISSRPPLLGLRALQEGWLMLPTGALSRPDRLEIDLKESLVHLSYP